mgnify:CR=1 FL=1
MDSHALQALGLHLIKMFASIILVAANVSANAAWPEKPITIIVPAAPGGTADLVSRLLSEKLSTALGTTVVVENKAGAAGIIGSQQLVRAAPDGYTLMMGNIGPNAINYGLYKTLPYRPDEFQPITLVISSPNLLVVNEQSPFKTVQELIDAIKKDPSKYSFGSSGAGQSPHLSSEMFMQRAGFQIPHIPYKGAGPSVAALMGNQYTFMIATMPSVMTQVRAGKLRALAITSQTRSSELPEIPTTEEAGIHDMIVTAWFGLLAPAGTPDDIIQKIQRATRTILDSPDIRTRFKDLGGEPGGNSSAEFTAFINQEIRNWKQTVERAQLTLE